MSRGMTLEDAVSAVVNRHGGIRAAERATGIDKSFLSRMMRGLKTHPSDETLAKLGLQAVPRYIRIPTTDGDVCTCNSASGPDYCARHAS